MGNSGLGTHGFNPMETMDFAGNKLNVKGNSHTLTQKREPAAIDQVNGMNYLSLDQTSKASIQYADKENQSSSMRKQTISMKK